LADQADAIVVGGGLAGLVAAAELADAGKRVIVLDQEGENRARRPGVLVARRAVLRRQSRTAPAAASRTAATSRLQDWMGTGAIRPRQRIIGRANVAEAYVDFAAGEMRDWLHARWAMRWFPVVGWAERGGALTRWATAIRCRAFMSPGAPARRGRTVRAARARACCGGDGSR
jgi:predicted oxidoreductase